METPELSPDQLDYEPSYRYDDSSADMGTMFLSDVIIEDRQRKDYGDMSKLVNSLLTFGQLQSILIDSKNRLIAGGRRCAAMKLAGIDTVKYVRIPDRGKAMHFMLEFEENNDSVRKGMTWLEKAYLIQEVEKHKKNEAVLNNQRWTQRMTGDLFGVAYATLSSIKSVLFAIETDMPELAQCETVYEAINKLIAHKEQQAQARRNALSAAAVNSRQKIAGNIVSQLKDKLDNLDEKTKSTPSENKTKTETPKTEQSSGIPEVDPLIALAESFLCLGDSILDLLPALPRASFDHIFTDPPFAIEMENLTDINNIDQTALQHQKEENEAQFEPFLRESFRVLRDRGFCVFFCDVEQFGKLVEIGKKVGFSTCDWPVICKKKNASNKAADYNPTKDYECIAIFRKRAATLLRHVPSSIIDFDWDSGEKKRYIHPFAKPRKLCLEVLSWFAQSGQRILDPYLGEGTLLTSILAHGCIPVGFEKEAIHIQRAIPHVVTELKKPRQQHLL